MSLGWSAGKTKVFRVLAFSAVGFCLSVCSLAGCSSECKGIQCRIHGSLEVYQGQRILRLSGTHYEMGYTMGYLMSQDIVDLINGYVATTIPDFMYSYAREQFQTLFSIPQPYLDEFQGILDGMMDSGVSLLMPKFNSQIDIVDLQLANAMSDVGGLFMVGCSSISTWGEATAADPVLSGRLTMCRDMDWNDPDHFLTQYTIVIAYESSVPGEGPWVSVGFPGYIGCLSGMNRHGVVAAYQVGPGKGVSDQKGCVPINLALRTGIERDDYNGDGRSDIEDVYSAVADQERVGGSDIHVLQPYVPGGADPAFIIECRYQEIAKRAAVDEPDFGTNILAATNHHRKLAPPEACWRYDRMRQMVQSYNYQLDDEKVWQIEKAAENTATIQTMLFVPDQLELRLSLTTATPTLEYAPHKTPVRHLWSDLFPK